MEARPDLTVKALNFERYSISYWPKTLRSRREPDKTYNFSSKMESNSQKPFPLERKIISLICQKTKKKKLHVIDLLCTFFVTKALHIQAHLF